jgi:ADP-heptose:LPS heptosyltransferase
MNIVISPYSRPMRNGKENPKNYPYWSELIALLKADGHTLIQIGLTGEMALDVHKVWFDLPLKEVKELLLASDTWISIDSWLQHLAHHLGKTGIVLYGQSDPLIFGYPENINLLKDRTYLRKHQFDIWESAEYNADAFISPDDILLALAH